MNNKSKLLKIIPSNWAIKRIKNIGSVNGGLTYSPDDVVDFDTDGAILVLRSSNIQEGKISYLDNVYVNVKVNKKQMTTIGDILICSRNGSRRLLGKNILIDENSKNLAFGAFMTILRTKYNRFVRYYLASGVFNDLLNSSTSTINQLTTRDINNIEIPLPSFIEQEKIVKFLDDKCSKVDQEVSLLQKKSILLDEYKNALIYETVTKGLDKNAEMKDSGVEWIGDIPSHWKPIRLKDIVKSKITSGSTPNEHLILLEDDLKSNFVNFYKIENVNKNGKISKKYIISDDTNSGMTRSKLKENDILFTIAGTIGTVAIITSNDLPANVNQAIAIIRVKDKINHDFVKYFLTLLKGNNSARGGVIKNINLTTLSNLTISLPLTTEQNEIADYLNLETLTIEKQIELINKKVELLKEYKQSLIYEAVTGQLEIE